MITEDTPMAGMLAALDEAGAQTAERNRQHAQRRAATTAARTKAEELATADAEASRLANNEALRVARRIPLEFSRQVSEARQQAIAAVHSGQNVADAWVGYRLTAARLRGCWAALSSEYQQATGVQPPPGPHAPDLRAEPFELFLRNAMPEAERQAYEQAQQQTGAELDAHRNSKAKQEAEQAATPNPSTSKTRRQSRP